MRFRKDYPLKIHGARPTRVDVAFTRARVAVFLDGCFWHGCPLHGQTPKSNAEFWAAKFDTNRQRDRLVESYLERDGWVVIRAWEHESLETVVPRIAATVAERVRRAPAVRYEQ